MDVLQKSITLPNGTIIANRIAKSAMSENISTHDHQPSKELINLYKEWAKSGAGLLITGNVMTDSNALGEPNNVVVEDESHIDLLKEWAQTTNGTETQLWVQINHPGRQAMEQINKELVGPSAIPLKMGGRKKASKIIPRALNENEILSIIKGYGKTAAILKDAGFAGVQIHGAHGYLVSQFLSPKANIRTDKWGGNIENRSRFALEVYREIRKKVGPSYPIGIKLNSADFQRGGFTEEESMEVVNLLSHEGIDLIEISGGTYEAPAMTGPKKSSTIKREAYFLEYIKKARKITSTPLMLTGGFRTVNGMTEGVASGHLDIVGLARPYCVHPNMANEIFQNSKTEFPSEFKKTGVKFLDSAMNIMWYEAQIKRIGQGKTPKLKLNSWIVFVKYVWAIISYKKPKK